MEVANGVSTKMEALERDNASKEDEIRKLKKEINSLRCDGDETAAAEEARSEAAAALMKVLEERESNITFLEREVKILKQENAESEMKVRDLERKNSVYEVRLSEERSKKVRAEEEMKEKVGDKEREIEVLKERIVELEKFVSVDVSVMSEGKKGLLLPIVAAASGAIAAVFYFSFRKQRR